MCIKVYHVNYFSREDPFAESFSFINLVADSPAMVYEGEVYISCCIYYLYPNKTYHVNYFPRGDPFAESFPFYQSSC